jgi:hypothetical protein
MIGNPQRRQIDSHRKEQSLWRGRKKWKNLVKTHAQVPGKVCVHCLKSHGEVRLDKNGDPQTNKAGKVVHVILTINHLSRTSYWTEDTYCTWNEADMEICCTLCNWKIESGLKPCPICHRNYIHWRDNTCQMCHDKAHPVEAEERALGKYKKVVLWGLKKVLKKEADAAERKRWKEEHPKPTRKRVGSTLKQSQLSG